MPLTLHPDMVSRKALAAGLGRESEACLHRRHVVALSSGNYVVSSPCWNNVGAGATDAGAMTWGNGTMGISGVVSSSNSLVGSTSGDQVGSYGVVALSNGNYVVISSQWANVDASATDAGAVTWGSGTTGTSGVGSSSNSLVGSTNDDAVGSNGVVALSNGNYVVSNPSWGNVGAGATNA